MINKDFEYHKHQVGKGWHKIVENLYNQLLSSGWNGKIEQVKEKFGTLRFYATNLYEKHYDIITQAEKESAITCENCGSKEEVSTRAWETFENEIERIYSKCGWIKTLCKECRVRYPRKYEKT